MIETETTQGDANTLLPLLAMSLKPEGSDRKSPVILSNSLSLVVEPYERQLTDKKGRTVTLTPAKLRQKEDARLFIRRSQEWISRTGVKRRRRHSFSGTRLNKDHFNLYSFDDISLNLSQCQKLYRNWREVYFCIRRKSDSALVAKQKTHTAIVVKNARPQPESPTPMAQSKVSKASEETSQYSQYRYNHRATSMKKPLDTHGGDKTPSWQESDLKSKPKIVKMISRRELEPQRDLAQPSVEVIGLNIIKSNQTGNGQRDSPIFKPRAVTMGVNAPKPIPMEDYDVKIPRRRSPRLIETPKKSPNVTSGEIQQPLPVSPFVVTNNEKSKMLIRTPTRLIDKFLEYFPHLHPKRKTEDPHSLKRVSSMPISERKIEPSPRQVPVRRISPVDAILKPVRIFMSPPNIRQTQKGLGNIFLKPGSPLIRRNGSRRVGTKGATQPMVPLTARVKDIIPLYDTRHEYSGVKRLPPTAKRTSSNNISPGHLRVSTDYY